MPHFNGWLSCALNAGDNRPAVGSGIMKGWNAGPVDGPVRRIPP